MDILRQVYFNPIKLLTNKIHLLFLEYHISSPNRRIKPHKIMPKIRGKNIIIMVFTKIYTPGQGCRLCRLVLMKMDLKLKCEYLELTTEWDLFVLVQILVNVKLFIASSTVQVIITASTPREKETIKRFKCLFLQKLLYNILQ